MAEGMNVQSANHNMRMKSTAHRAVHPAWFRLALCTLAFPLFAASCARPIQEHRGRAGDVIAEQHGSRLEAILPSAVDVPAARAAAEQTLRARGYVITETYGTLDRARVDASGTGDNRTSTTTFEAWRGSNGTRVRFDPGVFGDASASRSLLDELIARLGR